MVKTFCDRCGKVIESTKDMRKLIISNSGAHVYKYSDGTYDNLTFTGDICFNCAQEIIDGLGDEARAKIRNKQSDDFIAVRVVGEDD